MPSADDRARVLTNRPRVLWVTDLAYPAQGRRYGDEDVALTAALREDFAIGLCHPVDAVALMDAVDVVVVRNSGPVLHHHEAVEEFRSEARRRGTRVYNPLDGRADMAGKEYLVDLWAQGFPVIPTVDRVAHLDRLPAADAYVVKPKLGADSIGLQVLDPASVAGAVAAGPADRGSGDTGSADALLIQPRIDFAYEVSFTFVDDELLYALHAPRPDRRWDLVPYDPTPADRAFARRFIDWNGLRHGIQRVDACRLHDGGLLLVELEDLNPYLSLDLVDGATQSAFVAAVRRSITGLVRS